MTIEKNNSASHSLLIKFYQMCLLAFFYILFIASKPLLTKWIRHYFLDFLYFFSTIFCPRCSPLLFFLRGWFSVSTWLSCLCSYLWFSLSLEGLQVNSGASLLLSRVSYNFFEIFRISPKTSSYRILDPDLLSDLSLHILMLELLDFWGLIC